MGKKSLIQCIPHLTMVLLDKWLIIFIARKHYKQKRETKSLDRIEIETNKKALVFFFLEILYKN